MNGKHAELIAAEALGKPSGWKAYCWESKPDGILVKGAIPQVDLFGKKSWNPLVDESELLVTDSMFKEWLEEYPAKTGNCPECCGTGKVFKSWNHIDGTKHDTCSACDGSGKASAQDLGQGGSNGI